MNRRTDFKTKKILITGGAGYIGSHVNKRLHQCGYDTVVIDNLQRGHPMNVPYGIFIKGDIAHAANLEELFKKHQFDGIMHFAAHTDVGESVNDPMKYYQNNLINTLNLLNCAIKYQVHHLVFSSSAAVYGIPNQSSIDESHPCQPINPYGHTKLMTEKILEHFDQAYGMKSCCLRYFNAAGADPEQEIRLPKRPENNLIPRLLRSLKDNPDSFMLYGTDYPTIDGTCIRDYIHVADLAEAHVKGLEKLFSTSISSIYNLGNSTGFSVKEVIQSVQKITGCNFGIKVGPRRAGDPPILVANARKAFHELGWAPKFPDLETMISHTLKAMI